MDDTSVQLFINLISITVSLPSGSPSKKEKVESNRQVSFSMLQSMYNKKFNLQDNDQEHFAVYQVQNLQIHISKVIVDLTRFSTNKFDLREKFAFPISTQEDFINTLNKEPFLCSKDHSAHTLEELAKKYSSGYQRVNTQAFIVELEEKVRKLKEKDVIHSELKKSILKKNSSIERVFEEAISDIKKFKMEMFKPDEFYLVFVYLEINTISMQQVRDMLANFQEPDKEGKYSVTDFIKDFKLMNNTEPAAARKGRKFY